MRKRSGPIRPTRPGRRILLDTNVWRYVLDAGAGDRLIRAEIISGNEIVIAPAVVYEALRTQDPELRQSLAMLMSHPRWVRLMTEAYTESMELLGEIRRTRPEWLRPNPQEARFRQFRNDWRNGKRGFWYRLRTEPEREIRRLGLLGDDRMMSGARAEAKSRREVVREAGITNPGRLRETRAVLSQWQPGWRGDAVEPWRIAGWTTTTTSLMRPGSPHLDWLEPFVDTGRIIDERDRWLSFWLYDLNEGGVPSFWIRWAFEHLQTFRKTNDGTPGDAQLATYLPRVDAFVSADRLILQLLEDVRPHAQFRLPEGVAVRGGADSVEALLDIVMAQCPRA